MVALSSALAQQRKPQPGCQWVPWESEELGLRMQVQKCEGNSGKEFKVLHNKVRLVAPGQNIVLGTVVIEIWEKSGRQSMQDAINRKFYPDMTSRQQAGCQVVDNTEKFPTGDGNKLVYQIVPNAIYQREADRMRESEPGIGVCGQYGELDLPQYFEYHPGESKTRFFFLRLGPDAVLLDQHSLEFIAK